eukprot:TRINITY_DN300_c0_g1_i10.p2 TRINITY_DN300_c0_g1~~TRINITY_DN300_c0_g1_i10.p2  ORF type:complete len:156 (-),score=64.79 TRINITY_DN300_c0_g1_i10:231-698(-)
MTAQKPITDDDKEWVRFSQIQTLQPMKPGSHFAVRVDTPCPCERNSMGIVVGVATNVIESDGITAIIGTGSSNYGFGYVCNNGTIAGKQSRLVGNFQRSKAGDVIVVAMDHSCKLRFLLNGQLVDEVESRLVKRGTKDFYPTVSVFEGCVTLIDA